MELEVGPVPKQAARLYVDYAFDIVQHLNTDTLAFSFPSEVAADFAMLLLEWSAALERCDGDHFWWRGDLDATRVEVLVRYWFNLARQLLDRVKEGDLAPLPKDGEVFADALLRSALAGLVANGRIDGDTAARMWEQWPRLRELDSG